MGKCFFSFYVFFLGLFFSLEAQENPPIQIFPPGLMEAGNQNWMLSQDLEGQVFAGNNKGLLVYEGTRWKLYPSPENTIIRSVASIEKRVYTGSYMDFGYWEKNAKGDYDYTSLVKSLGISILEDEQFWNILPFGASIVFQSLDRLLIFNKKTQVVQSISSKNGILKSFKVNDQLFFQEGEGRLFTLEQGEKTLALEHPLLQNNKIKGIFRLENRLLLVSEKKGFFLWRENLLERWPTPIDQILSQTEVYNAIGLKNGGIALGTIGTGVYCLNEKQELLFHLNQEKGISNNTVLSLMEDQGENLWLGLDNGINLINAASPIYEFSDSYGKLGSIYQSVLYDGKLYLGTNQGLFVKPYPSAAPFERIQGSENQVWKLSVIDQTLFGGLDQGTFIIEGNKATQLGETTGTWLFKKHPTKADIILQGNYNGLHVLEKKDGKWQYKNKIEGFDISSRFFAFVNDTTLLVSHEYKGVFRVTLDEDLQSVKQVTLDPSVAKGYNASVAKFDGTLLYLNPSGFFKYNPTEDKFEKADELSQYIPEGEYATGKMINEEDNKLWFFSKSKIHWLQKDLFNAQWKHHAIFIDENQRKSVAGFENISPLNSKEYIIGTNNGYLKMMVENYPEKEAEVKISKIIAGKNEAKSDLKLEEENSIVYANNALHFYFTATNYNKYSKVEYQYMLEGIDRDWRPWTEDTHQAYENLNYGTYTFHVKSRLGSSISATKSSGKIEILPPWYFSTWANTSYIVMFLFVLWGYNVFYTRRIKRKQEQLNQKERKEIELQQLEIQKEAIRINNEKLKSDIDLKNKELAIAMMSTVKRNKLLNRIKKQLTTIEDPQVKPLIKSINANLKNEDDWKYFENVFNTADKDFFKKVKEVHPKLTSNDLKLCAYLRLNLSSKEIAPLLNISIHSVEIKRYRLRKKMNLTRSQGIVEYIMTL